MDASNSPDVTEHQNGGDEPQDPFVALLDDLNPFVDELLSQPEFHLFLDLPVELRYNIYEQYFLDNAHSITCKAWPELQISLSFVIASLRKKAMPAFLPNLCLVSKSLQDELLSCLVEPIDFYFESPLALARGITIVTYKVELLRIASKVRKISVQNVNQQQNAIVYEAAKIDAHAEKHNSRFSSILPIFPCLRELNIAFHAPLLCKDRYWPPRQNRPLEALSIKDYVRGFSLQAILSLTELQNITITGTSGFPNCHDKVIRNNNSIEGDGDIEHLQAIVDIGRQIKDGFKKQKRDVAVHLRLLYGRDKDDERVLS